MPSTQTYAVPYQSNLANGLLIQSKSNIFTDFSQAPAGFKRLLQQREKYLQSDFKIVNLHCSTCTMSLEGKYTRREAIPLEKEFKRQHNHDIIVKEKGGEKRMFLLLILLGILFFGFGFIGFIIKVAAAYIVLLIVLGGLSILAGIFLRE